MTERPLHSKRAVSRAGQLLAAHLIGPRETLTRANPEIEHARQLVEWWRAQHVGPMLAVHESVSAAAPPLELDEMRLVAVSFRPKRFESTIEKLTREPGKLADMVDIGGVRAVVNTHDEVVALHSRLSQDLDVRRVRDWAAHPRATGYRARHLHVRKDGFMVEVQLRTFGQDAWANVVEEESRKSGVNYKAGAGPVEVLDFFRAVADLFGTIELGEVHEDLPQRLYLTHLRARRHLLTPTLRSLEP